QLRIGRVERPAGQPRVRGQDLDELDEIFIAFGDRGVTPFAAVGVLDENVVMTVDVNVFHIRVLQQRLQATDAEKRRVDRRGHIGFLVGRYRATAFGDFIARMVLENLNDQRARIFAFIFGAHGGHAANLIPPALFIEPIGYLHAQAAYQLVVDHDTSSGDSSLAVSPAFSVSWTSTGSAGT